MAEYSHNATITFRQDLNDELIVIRVRHDDPLASFVPGQYTELALIEDPSGIASKIVRRQYSIASAPDDERGLEFYIVLVPDVFLTPKLWNLPEGSRIWMNAKCKGKFTLDPVPPGKRLILISTGTGIAPYVSMVRCYLEAVEPRWESLVLVHGVRFERDLGYRAELEELARSHTNITYIPATTREPEDSSWGGFRGRVQTLFEGSSFPELSGRELSPEQDQVFLCGNPAMIDAMQALLEGQGFHLHKKKNPGNIHLERYW